MLCVPNRDERLDFDAEIRDRSRRRQVEMTLARDPNWHHRMAYLLEHRHVAMWGRWPSTPQSCAHFISGW